MHKWLDGSSYIPVAPEKIYAFRIQVVRVSCLNKDLFSPKINPATRGGIASTTAYLSSAFVDYYFFTLKFE